MLSLLLLLRLHFSQSLSLFIPISYMLSLFFFFCLHLSQWLSLSVCLQGELVSQLREVVQAREATIAHLHSEQHHASIMLQAVRAERDRLQHEVCSSDQPPMHCLVAGVVAQF